MSKTLRITRLTLKEAMSRRLIPAGIMVSFLYIVLFAVAYNFAQDRGVQVITGQRSRALVSIAMASLTLSGLYIVNLLAGFLALFLSVGAVSTETDSGSLHALLARPMRRSQLLLGRWLAYALICSVYVSVMAGLVMIVAALINGYTVSGYPQRLRQHVPADGDQRRGGLQPVWSRLVERGDSSAGRYAQQRIPVEPWGDGGDVHSERHAVAQRLVLRPVGQRPRCHERVQGRAADPGQCAADARAGDVGHAVPAAAARRGHVHLLAARHLNQRRVGVVAHT
ncbi:MAG: hypothetical protein E6I52_09255 [Chloroflexi bacterium]|nr:MAG: hypothetical protein E6I52_09255 [Chloroflexota bacterium]